MIHMYGNMYDLVVDHKEGWKPEAFRERYSEILDKYDYIVGDWGYNQLRLKGFYSDKRPKLTHEMKIESLEEYLSEYCNFGCAYFVIKKVSSESNEKNTSEKTKEKNANEVNHKK